MQSDPLADFLTQIRNANTADKAEVVSHYSRLKNEVAHILKKEGYLEEVELTKEGKRQSIKLTLKSGRRQRAIQGIKRVSRPGLRRYVGSTEVPRVLGGLGIAIVSTSKGIMTGHDARKQNVGGELLAYVW
jgi:small subunit ribosomal protein S8